MTSVVHAPATHSNDRVRFGILGAARIAPFALVSPARQLDTVEVAGIAARDVERARAFAKKNGIPKAVGSYDALLNDPHIEAIYNPLPNSLHAEWTIRALEAGKHVLCEKPLTLNADEAERVADAARQSGRVLMEAFHWRYHPMAQRMREIIKSGELGTIRRVETWMCIPLVMSGDIRFQLALGGGAGMDVGSYTVSMQRHLMDEEPEVVSAQAWLKSPGVDRRIESELRFPSGATGHTTASLFSQTLLWVAATVVGDRGTMTALNPVIPQVWHRLTVTIDGQKRSETFEKRSTYSFQLEAFAQAVRGGGPVLTGPDDAIANMRLIDAVYRAAGMQPRGVTP